MIFKTVKNPMTWDMGHPAGREPGALIRDLGHSVGREPGPLLRAKRGLITKATVYPAPGSTPMSLQDGSDLHEPQAQAMSRSVSRSELSLVLNVTVISMPQLSRESTILNL